MMIHLVLCFSYVHWTTGNVTLYTLLGYDLVMVAEWVRILLFGVIPGQDMYGGHQFETHWAMAGMCILVEPFIIGI